MEHLTPTLIMFGLTVIFASMSFFPMTRFPLKNALVNFYWSGFWTFLALIVVVAGAKETLMIAGQDVDVFSTALILALTVTFVMFVIFGWARLALKGAATITRKKQA